jgi:endoglucanase
MTRRDLLAGAVAVATTAAFGAAGATSARKAPAEKGAVKVSYSKLPRWRGFNLLEKFTLDRNQPFREEDFDIIAEWGFDFVRLPMDYRCWTDPNNPKQLKEAVLKEIDQAVQFGRSRRIHVCINFHRAPGYCVNPPREPLDLWSQEEALELCCYHWAAFAKRYKGIPNEYLSFNLLNEPGNIPSFHIRSRGHGALVRAIRAEDPNRLVIADGILWGNTPVPELVPLKIAQSTRGYDPMQISHYKASWIERV